MFCPRCGTQNRSEQKYCRHCGLSLSGVRLALEERIDRVGVIIQKDFDKLSGGIVTLVIFILIALVSALFSSFNAAINLILGLLIAGPMIYKGLKRLDRSITMIVPKAEARQRVKDHKGPAVHQIPDSSAPDLSGPDLSGPDLSGPDLSGPDLSGGTVVSPVAASDPDPLLALQIPNSVTEQTTFDLKAPVAGR